MYYNIIDIEIAICFLKKVKNCLRITKMLVCFLNCQKIVKRGCSEADCASRKYLLRL